MRFLSHRIRWNNSSPMSSVSSAAVNMSRAHKTADDSLQSRSWWYFRQLMLWCSTAERLRLKPVAHGEIKHCNCFSLISMFFNTAKLFECFGFRDVRTSEIKLQLNNAAGVRLYLTRPHIPETEIKQNCRRSAETKPRPSAVLFYFSF